MTTQQAAQGRYKIEIKPNDTGAFDVLSDGTSYRIHRNLSGSKADTVAAEIKALLKKQGIRSVILKATAGHEQSRQSGTLKKHSAMGNHAAVEDARHRIRARALDEKKRVRRRRTDPSRLLQERHDMSPC